jgi:hypothetical protein
VLGLPPRQGSAARPNTFLQTLKSRSGEVLLQTVLYFVGFYCEKSEQIALRTHALYISANFLSLILMFEYIQYSTGTYLYGGALV